VPLEFDEEDDEEFHSGSTRLGVRDETSMTRTSSTGDRDSGVSMSTSTHDLDDDTWDGWGPEEKEAIKAAGRFDDVSAVGYLDEEQAPMI
jgi:hypothetical protein